MLRYQKGNSLKCSAQPQRVENIVEIEIHINPIPAGVLENQDMLGVKLTPPPLNPMFDVQI